MRALQYTVGSPFARAIRILLDELDLDYIRHEIDAAPSGNDSDTSPTMQVPTFWDGGLVLWDSGLIAEYLLKTYPRRPAADPILAADVWRPPFEWRDKLVSTSVQTLLTSITTISQLTWTGVCVGGNAHLDRCVERLPSLLAWLEAQLPDDGSGFIPGTLAVQDIMFVSGIRFAEARPIGVEFSWKQYPRLAGC